MTFCHKNIGGRYRLGPPLLFRRFMTATTIRAEDLVPISIVVVTSGASLRAAEVKRLVLLAAVEASGGASGDPPRSDGDLSGPMAASKAVVPTRMV